MDPYTSRRRRNAFAVPIAAAAVELNQGLSELAKLAWWLMGFAAGAVTGLFESRPTVAWPTAPPRTPKITLRPIQPPPPEALPLLTEAIVGSSKHTVAEVLGAPRSVVVEGIATIEENPRGAFFQSDTWYYSMPRHGKVGMAISFAGDVAQKVEFFHAPVVDEPAYSRSR